MEDKRVLIRVRKNLGRLLRWLNSATSKDAARRILEGIHIGDPEDKDLPNAVWSSDGFRIHAIKHLNEGEPEEDLIPTFQDRLHVAEGTYEFEARVDVNDHINELRPVRGTYPDVKGIIPSLQANMKPVMVLAMNPRYLRDAIRNASRGREAVYIRVYQAENEIKEGRAYSMQAYEIITRDHHEENIIRMAVVMPMHIHEKNPAEAGIQKHWPVAFEGFPEKEDGDADETV